jgi:SynChlorMet cassette protein ScmC
MIKYLTSYQINMVKPPLANKSGYCMRLANGQGWHISATEELRLWTEKLAAIMQLKACEPNGYPKLIFVRKKSEEILCGEPQNRAEEKVVEELTGGGWKSHDIYNIRFWSKSDETDVICEMGSSEGNLDFIMMRYSLYPIYRRAQLSGGLPLHAGLVERDGKGVLLAAPKNTGKSTCCRRLPGPWYPLCDEETLIVRDDQERYLVHPFPTWSDWLMRRSERTWNIHHHLLLSAIFFMEQGNTDEVIHVGQGEAAVFMYNSAMQVCCRYWNNLDREEVRTRKKNLFQSVCELARAIPTFKLRVSLGGKFWEEMEKVLS